MSMVRLVLIVLCWSIFFFFKQKTAYEMRISDWSSDVCSSDLSFPWDVHISAIENAPAAVRMFAIFPANGQRYQPVSRENTRAQHLPRHIQPCWSRVGQVPRDGRSEEHTSELQSLMRISYAVFCLKKKNNEKTNKQILQT